MLSRTTRSQNLKNQNANTRISKDIAILGKREAEIRSPEKNQLKKKRSALSDVTNKSSSSTLGGKPSLKSKAVKGSRTKSDSELPVVKIEEDEQPLIEPERPLLPSVTEDREVESEDSEMTVDPAESEEADLSLSSTSQQSEQTSACDAEVAELCSKLNWVDIDRDTLCDPHQVAIYANDIFAYCKERELKFLISDYTSSQPDITVTMRAVLVDWLVEVQENFELNHETLYIAVKLVDQHLHRHRVTKEMLQLVGTTAMFIACKFEERCPPVLDDFLYICDDAYNRDELIAMEQKILIGRDFDLGVPLSYSFLRRYSKCSRTSIETLTLARFILETSLMDIRYVSWRDSQMAAACLCLAQRMRAEGQWDDTMVHYTGYDADSLKPLMTLLNDMLVTPPYKQLSTIRSKYSHQIFHEVAKISPLERV